MNDEPKNIWFGPNKPYLNPILPTKPGFVAPPRSPPSYKSHKKWGSKTSSTWQQRKYTKYKFHADDGKKLAAAGILFFEQTTYGKGIWVIEEEENDKLIYTDFGGKYDHNDGDILATACREFREETYNTQEITYKDIKTLPSTHHVYINGYDGNPVYLCVVMHINQFNITFNSKSIEIEKEKILKANPSIPKNWYRTKDVKFILLKDISNGKYRLSNRLAAILRTIIETNNQFSQEIENFFSDLEYVRQEREFTNPFDL